MHRVELKASFLEVNLYHWSTVPNAPCGVESRVVFLVLHLFQLFLMHRVELKATEPAVMLVSVLVPNAPCGVERA